MTNRRTASRLIGALAVLPLTASPHASAGRQHLAHYQASRISMACEYTVEAYGPDADALPRIADDALDDAFFVLGPERGQAYLRRLHATEALYFVPDQSHHWRLVRQRSGS